jgi:SHS2 domain-containing protein
MKKIIHELHTANVQIMVEADTLEELFTGALEGMNSILKINMPANNIDKSEVYEIMITSLDVTTLLIDFLSEALTMSYEKRMIFTGLKILELKTHFIKARIYGIPVESFDDDIKGVTYHMAKVEKNASGKWQTRIIFDI